MSQQRWNENGYNNNNNSNRRGNRRYRRNNNRNNYGNSQNNNSGWNKPTKPYTFNNNNNSTRSGCCDDDGNWRNFPGKSHQKLELYKSAHQEAYFDTHCHLDWILFKLGYSLREFPNFAQTHLTDKFAGCVTVACAPDMVRTVSELINAPHEAHKHIYGTFGMHPHNAKEWNDTAKQQIVFALKTGKWNVNQSNSSSLGSTSAATAQSATWMCLCGHTNFKTSVFCAECAWEPNAEYLANAEILDKVKQLNTKHNTDDVDHHNDNNEEEEKKEAKEQGQGQQRENHKVVAVGECGLDFHYNKSPQDVQKKVFVEQIEIAKQLDMPLVVHSRKAENDTIEIMKKYCPANKPIHLHCFTDSLEYGKIILTEFPNLCVGFTGSITFRNADKNRNTVKNIPLNRILLETDGPYMSPTPYYKKVSHPGYIPLIAEQVASLHGIRDVNKVLKQCRLNAKSVYGV
mmetsp:Transcript_46481/g.74499  ORF Transcript_46481/g.74499 Transcript_46481/m.74499 type:complete len:458 (+) Transcript_46481:31-1404(+)|eukprot:CAMPEP_0197022632 /NCGR_PEP_ID=MMETSP1384-20130603/3442_1 /TAXON_ID=29189 /ORGANISM="Ammonia sp." /LENGTH=457 /DNA_ID=CAMNT_0042450703 /DNA_START=31 /DNA_END=1404 /DNA_ORIENTATION=+